MASNKIKRKKMPGNQERKLWNHIPPAQTGKIVSLDDLDRLFQADYYLYSEVKVLYDKEKYIIYGINEKRGIGTLPRRVAYQCKKCEVISLGSPNIESSLDDKFNGKFGYSVSCRQCDTLLEENTFEVD